MKAQMEKFCIQKDTNRRRKKTKQGKHTHGQIGCKRGETHRKRHKHKIDVNTQMEKFCKEKQTDKQEK
jgi:hypothetical protein